MSAVDAAAHLTAPDVLASASTSGAVFVVSVDGVDASEVERALAATLARAVHGEPAPGLPIDLGGRTPFEAQVLRATMTIPWGEVRPYAWVAREAGRPRAVRAGANCEAARRRLRGPSD